MEDRKKPFLSLRTMTFSTPKRSLSDLGIVLIGRKRPKSFEGCVARGLHGKRARIAITKSSPELVIRSSSKNMLAAEIMRSERWCPRPR
jgi:hypothetical protein